MQISDPRQMARFTIAVGDFKEAVTFLDLCEAHRVNWLVYKALAMSAVILYARPFSPNERKKDARSALAIPRISIDWFRNLTASDRELHTWLIKNRNEVIAHAGSKHNPSGIDPETAVNVSRRAHFPGMDFNPAQVRGLAEKLISQCEKKRADYAISLQK